MSGAYLELKEDTFQKQISKGIWVIDFWAEWCGPCKIMSPEFEKAAQEMNGKVYFGKVNVDQESSIAGQFEVMSIPTLIIFKDGNEFSRRVGALSKLKIIEEINNAIKG